jgi:hypothetical protein
MRRIFGRSAAGQPGGYLGLGGTLPRAQIHPDNLWALRGLLDCLQRRGEVAEAALIRQRMDFAAARADQPVSCLALAPAVTPPERRLERGFAATPGARLRREGVNGAPSSERPISEP